MKYSEKIVIYIDILGFKGLIDSTIYSNGRENQVKIDLIKKMYTSISRICNLYLAHSKKLKSKSNLQITKFSDCIVVSCNYSNDLSVVSMLLITRSIAISLLNYHIIVRGAVTKGKIYHSNTSVFGPALIDSYLKEIRIAKYPRIIFDKEIAAIVNKYPYSESDPWDSSLKQKLIKFDKDKIWYIDYFILYPSDTTGFYGNPKKILIHLNNLKAIILKGLKIAKSKKDDSLINKYYWMIEKYNESLEYYHNSNVIDFFFRLVSHYTNDYLYQILLLKRLNKNST